MPYEQTAAVIEKMLNVKVSGRQVEHIVDHHGRQAIEERDRAIEDAWNAPAPLGSQPEWPEVLYIEADGAYVNSREGLRAEGKVGLVHQGPEQVGREHQHLRLPVYVTTFDGSQRLDRLHSRLRAAQARDAITELKRYILNNRVGIGYADLYEQGIHVGSGLVEKAADLVINRRCELRSMTWYRDTANGICNLRAFLLNPADRWHDFWLN